MFWEVTVFVDQVCIILAIDIFEWSPALDTYKKNGGYKFLITENWPFISRVLLTVLEGVIVVTRVAVEEEPIQAEQLFFQHLCQPS